MHQYAMSMTAELSNKESDWREKALGVRFMNPLLRLLSLLSSEPVTQQSTNIPLDMATLKCPAESLCSDGYGWCSKRIIAALILPRDYKGKTWYYPIYLVSQVVIGNTGIVGILLPHLSLIQNEPPGNLPKEGLPT